MKKLVKASYVTFILTLLIVGCSKNDDLNTDVDLIVLEQATVFDFSKGKNGETLSSEEKNNIKVFPFGKTPIKYGEWTGNFKGIELLEDGLTIDLNKIKDFKTVEIKYSLNGQAVLTLTFKDDKNHEISNKIFANNLDGIRTNSIEIPMNTKTIEVTANEGIITELTIAP